MNSLEEFQLQKNIYAMAATVTSAIKLTKPQTEEEYVLVDLTQDNNKHVRAYMFIKDSKADISVGMRASFVGSFEVLKNNEYFHIIRMHEKESNVFDYSESLTTLVQDHYSENNEISAALNFIFSAITKHELLAFVYSVLSNKEVIEKLNSLPATQIHHHTQKSGLLTHSIEVALFVMQLSYVISDIDLQILIVAALFHDLDRINSDYNLSYDRSKTFSKFILDIEHYGINFLKPYFGKLEQDWAYGAKTLKGVLLAVTDYRNSYSDLAIILRTADTLSILNDEKKLAFKHIPDWFLVFKASSQESIKYFNFINKQKDFTGR